jgi:hypothetical protein
MIIRILPDNRVVKIKSIKSNEEDLFLEINAKSGFKKIDKLPYSRYDFYKLDENGNIVVDIERELVQFKKDKKAEIKSEFLNEQKTGHFTCSLGFDIDANDEALRNINSLIDYLPDDTTEIQFRDYNNTFHTLTKPDLIKIKKEMITYGLSLYQKKWQLEQQIEQATTIEEVENIKW